MKVCSPEDCKDCKAVFHDAKFFQRFPFIDHRRIFLSKQGSAPRINTDMDIKKYREQEERDSKEPFWC